MGETKKSRLFYEECMKNKPITAVPGVGAVCAEAFMDLGISKASDLYKVFLLCGSNREKFRAWTKENCELRINNFNACYDAFQKFQVRFPMEYIENLRKSGMYEDSKSNESQAVTETKKESRKRKRSRSSERSWESSSSSSSSLFESNKRKKLRHRHHKKNKRAKRSSKMMEKLFKVYEADKCRDSPKNRNTARDSKVRFQDDDIPESEFPQIHFATPSKVADVEEPDLLKSFFLQMWGTAKSFPQSIQVKLKKQIFNIINEAEINLTQEDAAPVASTSSNVENRVQPQSSTAVSSTPQPQPITEIMGISFEQILVPENFGKNKADKEGHITS